MKCPNCKKALSSNEVTLYDRHGAVVFNCECGGRLVVKFWPETDNKDNAKALCSFDASGCTKQ